MYRIALLVLALAGCGVNGYYVSNVYATGNGLVVERCEITQGNHVHPDACHLEQVGPPPGGVIPYAPQGGMAMPPPQGPQPPPPNAQNPWGQPAPPPPPAQ